MSNILYEASSKFDFSILILPVIMIIFALLFPLFVKKSFENKNQKLNISLVRIVCLIGIVNIILWSAIVIIAQLRMYDKTVGAYTRGEYQIVEGYVENFDPMPYEGHKNESFEINGVQFSYSDYNIHPGYNNAKSHGGVIEGNNQHLKIGYVYINKTYGNIIVYIEEISD